MAPIRVFVLPPEDSSERRIVAPTSAARVLHMSVDRLMLLDRSGHVVAETFWSDVQDIYVEKRRFGLWSRLWVCIRGAEDTWWLRPLSWRQRDTHALDFAHELRAVHLVRRI